MELTLTNVEQLMDTVSQIMKSNADSRVKTAERYMDVAKKDLDARLQEWKELYF